MNKLRILHVSPSMSPKSGGPATSIAQMIYSSIARGHEVEVITSDDDGLGTRTEYLNQRGLFYKVHFLSRKIHYYTYTPEIKNWLHQHIDYFDLLHIHGIFSHIPVVGGKVARKHNIPYVISPHGIANRYGLSHKPIRKRISLRLFERELLRCAATIHMTSSREALEFKDLMIDAPVEMIPLSLPEQAIGSAVRFFDCHSNLRECEIIVFLGRLDPIKNIEGLMEAFAILAQIRPSVHLVIAGSGEPKYEAQLREKADIIGVAARITWLGFVSPSERADVLAAAKCAALVSFSESFGMAALECFAAGLPCVISQRVAVGEMLAESGLAILVDLKAADISEALCRALELASDPIRQQAALYAAEHFSEVILGDRLVTLYRNIVTKRPSLG